MKYNPHDYQEYAKNFIVEHREAVLFLDCGMGKTAITLTAISELLGHGVRRVLVIAPLRVARDTWPAEIEKWDHLRGINYRVAIGKPTERLAAIRDRQVQVTIINRENVSWLVKGMGRLWDFDMVVIDELSSFKAWRAKRFKDLLKVRYLIQRIVGLTGTPSSNGLMDLWAQYRLLDQGTRLGQFITQYRNQYFLPDKRNGEVIFSYKLRDGAEEQIYNRISDITVSMRSADYLNLPERIDSETVVNLSSDEKEAYDTLRKDCLLGIGDQVIDAASAGVLCNKLLQMANGAIYDSTKTAVHVHDRKLDALEDIIEAANGRPLMVAYWFQHDLDRIKERFPFVREIKTSEDIAAWNYGQISVALIHPASAGHGLNLQAGGNILVWFGLTWSLELYEQTNARLYRQGQENTVIINHIIAQGTVDERVMEILKSKSRVQNALIEAVKAELGGVYGI